MRGRTRRGNMLVLVAFLAMIIFIAISAISFMGKSDRSTTANLMREMHATHLAESIAAQVEAQVNSGPWNERFWLREAILRGDVAQPGQPMLNMFVGTPYINLSGDSLPTDEYEFAANVKDIKTESHQYRLYVEATVRGEKYAFSWDKRWDQSLTTGMNRSATELDKPLDMDGDAPVDKLIEDIKKEVDKAPNPEGVDPAQEARIGELRKDELQFDAQTPTPEPTTPPNVPLVGGGEN